MCGIAGYHGAHPPDESRISECLRLMRHRGPDASGQKSFRHPTGVHTLLLHTRLSIIDLDPRSSQPFGIDGDWLVFNGELYNYVELGQELRAEGWWPRTTGDTEILLETLCRGGLESLETCEGMWAFALYNESTGNLHLARDRFGEKPLYILEDETGFYFASEVKALFALRGRRSPVNREQVLRHLVNGYKALYKTNATFFEGVRELPAATWLRLGPNVQAATHTYWKPAFSPAEMTYEEAVDGVRARLHHSMRLRLRADVPLAFCMSGGVDSNALIGMASRELGYDVHGFTIASGDPRYDEAETAVASARELGIRHTVIHAETSNFLPRLRELVRIHDAPVYTITYYAHWMIQQAVAAAGYKVSVSGTAADELLSGYYDHHLAYLREVLHGACPDEGLHARALADWERLVKPVVRNPYLSDPNLFVHDPTFRGHIYLQSDVFSSWLKTPWTEPFHEESFTGDLLRNRMLNELRHENVPVILHEDDLNAMSVSVENRSPYLDRALVDFCYTIPTRHLVRNGHAKSVLRDAARGWAPDLILDNPRKVGFNLPITALLDTRDPATRDALMAESPVFDLVRREAVAALLDRDSYPNSESKFLFNFVNAKIFLEEFAS